MGRIQVTYPFVFGGESGNHPASELDQNFDAVPDTGILTIRAAQLSGADYQVVTNDEYSFFVCKGTTDFQVIPPNSPATGFGFFVSNETTQDAGSPPPIAVTLCCTVYVGFTAYLNPTLVGNFPPFFFNVKGGLMQYDGNNWNLYPLFYASSGGGAIAQGSVNVLTGDTSVTITHGFNEAGLGVQLQAQWNTTIWLSAQTNTTATFDFSNPAPSNLTLKYYVIFP